MTKNTLEKWFYLMIIFLWVFSLVISSSVTGIETTTRYAITPTYLQIIRVAFSIPTLIMWLMIGYAAISFNRYSEGIIESEDGKGYWYISQAFFIMLFSMILSNYITGIGSVIKEIHGSTEYINNSITIVKNFFGVFLGLATYYSIFYGSQLLMSSISVTINWRKVYLYVGYPLFFVGLGYLAFIFTNDYRSFSAEPLIRPTYALPDILILFTIGLPNILSWFFGFAGLYLIVQFSHRTPGVIYKKLLRSFVVGISLILILTIVLQFLTQLSNMWVLVGIKPLLMIVTGLFVIILIGFYLIARSARNLEKIESI